MDQRIAFADLVEVRVRFSGSGGTTLRNDQIFLIGPPGSGRTGVVVSRFHAERGYFEHAVSTAP